MSNVEKAGMPIPKKLPATELYIVNIAVLVSSGITPARMKTVDNAMRK